MVAGGLQTSGMAEIRGIDIDKLAKGYADEEMVLRKFVKNTPTSAREIRWYQKTAGFLDTTDTSGMTLSRASTDQLALPEVIEQSLTRDTSYVKKFFFESPTISDEDIKDSDPDVIGINTRDIVRAVSWQIDRRIYDIAFECTVTSGTPLPVNANTTAATGTGWDDLVNGNPIKDIMTGKRKIRSFSYDPEGAILYINEVEHENLLNYLINVKGSSIPQFASQKVETGVVMEILGCRVVVSHLSTTDYVPMFVPQRAVTWKSFTGLRTAIIDEPLIGKKIRCSEEGEALQTDPKAIHVTTDTVT